MKEVKREELEPWIDIFCTISTELIWRAENEPDRDISLEPFAMRDVEEVIAIASGNCCDEEFRDWLGVFKLGDGRYVAIVNAEILDENCESGCLPDEWGAGVLVAHSKKALISSLTEAERNRLDFRTKH